MLRIEARPGSLLVDLSGFYTAASTVEGLSRVSYVVFNYVDKGFRCSDPRGYRRRVARSLGLNPEETLVFITAVEEGSYIHLHGDQVELVATVGLRPPACVEQETLYEPAVATINMLVFTEEPVTVAALLDLLRVASEAKALASAVLLLRCPGPPSPASGTVTDAVAAVGPVSSDGAPWAGMATRLGNEAARLAYRAVLMSDNRGPEERLRDILGLGVEELLDDMERLYSTAPVPGVDAAEARRMLHRMLVELLRDPNVWAFLAAARWLDIMGHSGALPGVDPESFDADTKAIVADEALASMLALYVSGFRGLLAAYWVDRSKRRLGLRLAELPVFEDDAASALTGSLLSLLYTRLLSRGGGEP